MVMGYPARVPVKIAESKQKQTRVTHDQPTDVQQITNEQSQFLMSTTDRIVCISDLQEIFIHDGNKQRADSFVLENIEKRQR